MTKSLKLFIKGLDEKTGLVSDFNDDDFSRLVDHMTVYTKKKITVTFKGGYEVRIVKNLPVRSIYIEPFSKSLDKSRYVNKNHISRFTILIGIRM